MNLQENIRRVLNEETLRQILMFVGIRDTAKSMSVSIKELLGMAGLTGTQKDMIFLIEAIMENEVKEQLKYCSYNIVPSFGSIKLYVFIPKPAPEDEGRWSRDQWVCTQAEDLISDLSYKLGGGLIRGHIISVSNTANC